MQSPHALRWLLRYVWFVANRFQLREPVDDAGNVIKADYDLGQVKIECTRDIAHEDAGPREEGLPEGWNCKVSPEGRVFYVNQDLKRTQWNHPAMAAQELPDGWIKDEDHEGRTCWIDTKSGKIGEEGTRRRQFTLPSESRVIVSTRHSIVQLQNHVTRVMRQNVDLNNAAIEREAMEKIMRHQSRSQCDKQVIQNEEFKSYRGRLSTFVGPMTVVLEDGVQVNMGGWPHGFHQMADRGDLGALLKQEAIRKTGTAKNVKVTEKLKLQGIIPILEGFAYLRYGHGDSVRWDRLYLELQQIPDGTEDAILLAWGNLDPFNVHQTKISMQSVGYFNVKFLTNVSCISLSTKDVEHIKSQSDHLVRVKNLFGLRLESGSEDMKIAFLDQRTCMDWEANLRAPQLQRLGRLSPEIMARAGFIFWPIPSEGKADRVLCPFCGSELHGWKETDDVGAMHAKANAKCLFVAGRHQDKDADFTSVTSVLIPGMGSTDSRVARTTPFTDSRASNFIFTKTGNATSAECVVPYMGRGALGVKDTHDEETLVLQLQNAAHVEKDSFYQETHAVAHQKSMMQHRRRMHTVMHGDEGGKLLEMAAANDKEGVTTLLDNGAPVNFVDGGMRTALHWAAAMGHEHIVEILIDRGANPNARTVFGLTALTLADKGGFALCAYHIQINAGTY